MGEGRDLLGKLWQDIVPEAVHFVRKHLKEPVTTVDNALVASCFNIMDALLRPFARYHICLSSMTVQCSNVLCLLLYASSCYFVERKRVVQSYTSTVVNGYSG